MAPAPLARAVDAALEATVVLSFSRVGSATRVRLGRWRPVEQLAGTGRTVVVTGGNSGLGYATASAVLAAGARVRLVVRSDDKGADAAERLRRDVGSGADVAWAVADLLDLASVRALAGRLADEEPRIDALVHNAGAMFADRAITDDGLERTYQVHVVGPHLLTRLLLPTLGASAPARVVFVSSGGMYAEPLVVDRLTSPDGYRPTVAYARAKRAQVELTAEWQRRVGELGIDVHAVHPGWALTPGVESSLPRFRRLVGPILRDPDEGADTIAWLTLSADATPGGRLWHDRAVRSPHKLPWTRAAPGERERLWHRVEADAGLHVDVAPAP